MSDEKKYFCMTMRVQLGEYSYDNKYLIMAKDQEEAEKIARHHASTFYGDSDNDDTEDTFYFHGGAVATQLRGVSETDMRTFLMSYLTIYTLGGCVPKQQIEIGY